MSYHLTQTNFRLFSPQTKHHTNGDYSEVYDCRLIMFLTDHQTGISIDIEQTNIPVVYNYLVLDNEKQLIGPQMG